MKNAKRILALICVICLCMAFTMKSYAVEPLSMATMGGITYAIAQASGMEWIFNGATAASTASWIENRINQTLQGRTLAEVVQGQVARVVSGKLIVPTLIYNFAKQVISDLITEKGINDGTQTIIEPSYALGVALTPSDFTKSGKIDSSQYRYLQINPFGRIGRKLEVTFVLSSTTSIGYNYQAEYFLDDELKGSQIISTSYTDIPGYILTYQNGSYYIRFVLRSSPNYTITNWRQFTYSEAEQTGSISVNIPSLYDPPTVDVGYQWVGSIDGTSPDTNLDQLIDIIYDNIAEQDFNVTGEVTEEAPTPTPIPTFEPYPPVDDILPGINTGIEIGNDLIVGQQAQTGAITQGLEGVQEAVGSLEGTLEAIADIPAEEDLTDFKFDLRELFPFCIPFDIYRLLSSFDAEPAAPRVQLPIVIDSINFRYNLDLDFSAWDPVAQAMRTAELIVYAIGLAWATGKVIKW